VAPLASAVAVLAVVVGLASFAGPGHRGSGSPLPSRTAAVTPRTPVADTFGFPAPVDAATRGADNTGVVVNSFRASGRTLSLSYTIGTAACYGRIDTPQVDEAPDSVTVTLRRLPAHTTQQQSCAPITLTESVDVRLSEPLGNRAVRDGSQHGVVVPEDPGTGSASYSPLPVQ
jgi:hypothetical protein